MIEEIFLTELTLDFEIQPGFTLEPQKIHKT